MTKKTRPPNYMPAHCGKGDRAQLRDAGQQPQRSTTKRRRYSNGLLRRTRDLWKAHQRPRTDAPETFRRPHHRIAMTRTRSLSAKQLPTPNHHSQNIVRGRPQSCPVSQISTTTSWGLPPRTPPESLFNRGHRNKGTEAKTTKTMGPSTSKGNTTDGKTQSKQQPRNPKPAETTVEPPTKKKKTKKSRGGLEDLVQEQDKLYTDLNKVARKSK